MKTKIFLSSLMSLLFAGTVLAQDKTTVNATSSEISDNLDLRAVASLFGDSKDLEDFENRLNDPKTQISNLDLNSDNQVDYLRVIESVEGNSHLIVVQSVLGRDTFQDVATIEVERDSNNVVQVQVVGDVYMYGTNYIYEPVYVSTPIIYTHFWAPRYTPYYSGWYWGYYPSYYTYWNPYPVYRYRQNIGIHINFNHHYNYGYARRNTVVYNNYYARRNNGYERQYPNRSFESRNSGFTNRRELEKSRPTRDVVNGSRNASGTRNATATRNNAVNTPRSTTSTTTRNTATPRNTTTNTPRTTSSSTPRSASTSTTLPRTKTTSAPRSQTNTTRSSNASAPRQQNAAPRNANASATPRNSSNSGVQSRGNSDARGSRR